MSTLSLTGPSSCTSASNSIEIRNREAILIPRDLYELAPSVAVAISPLRTTHTQDKLTIYSDNGATGTLLPNDEMLTAAHAFKRNFDLAKKPLQDFILPVPPGADNEATRFVQAVAILYPLLVNQSMQFASVVAFEPVDTTGGDWVLFAFTAPNEPIRNAVSDAPLSHLVRFDGSKPIPQGTPLYCVGFPRTPGEKPGLSGIARSLTIIQGRAIRDFGPDEEIEAISDTEIDMRGMSGGPVGTYDFWTREFTVVGTVTHGTTGSTLFGHRFGQPLFVTSRIAPFVMKRLEHPPESSK